MSKISQLSEFLAEVVMTSYYLAEPQKDSGSVLHDAEMKSLKIIKSFGPMRMQELANYLHTSKSRATQIVCVLEKHGLVERINSVDKRVHMVSATAKGQREVEFLRSRYLQLAAAIEDKLGNERTAELCSLLAEITPLHSVTNRKEETHELNI